mmetsp:Transcript_81816/g.162388  ORF Transcript_81816/g.162388 Transcript_81816/m.162388 type:complete len:571 (-) Transcript_81816:172-1884(-)
MDAESDRSSLTEFYAAKSVLITGCTGFLGKVILEKILWERCKYHSSGAMVKLRLLVRPMKGVAAGVRLKQLFESHAFERLRHQLGDAFDAFLEDSVQIVEGDLTKANLGLDAAQFADLACSLDLILHSAAHVKWGAPLDVSVQANSLGCRRMAELARATQDAGRHARLVVVSSAFVHGQRKGRCPEEFLPRGGMLPSDGTHELLDATREVEVCLQQAAKVEAESWLPASNENFHRMARQRLGPSASDQAREVVVRDLRQRWRDAQMSAWGTLRAKQWGFNDCYTFSKALGERLVAEVLEGTSFAIVRPSGIVSAVREPYPGWIDAYLLVEPLIEGVGRGQITSFPGDRGCVIDCVPVDYVCNVILAAAVALPESGSPRVYHCASGDIYANTLGDIEATWLDYFSHHPLLDARGRVPKLRPIQYHSSLDDFEAGMRRRYVAPLRTLATVVESVPFWERAVALRNARGWLVRNKRVIEKTLDLARLYSTYTLNDWVFETTNARTLMASLSTADRRSFPYFPERCIHSDTPSDALHETWDWRKFWMELHIPGMRRWVLKEQPSSTPAVRASKL